MDKAPRKLAYPRLTVTAVACAFLILLGAGWSQASNNSNLENEAEIGKLSLGIDQVYSGFAIGGSTAAQSFPVPALRLVLHSGETVLLDRGSYRRLIDSGKLIGERIEKPLEIDPQLQQSSVQRKAKQN